MNWPLFWRAKSPTPVPVAAAPMTPMLRLNPAQLMQHLRTLPQFAALQAHLGPYAQITLDRIVSYLLKVADRGVPNGDVTYYDDNVASMLEWEAQVFQEIRPQLAELWSLARVGELAARLAAETRDPMDYRYPASPLDDDWDKAIAWVNSHDNSNDMRRITRQALEMVVNHIDVRSRRAFIHLHMQIYGAHIRNTARVPVRGERYCSEGGGQALWTVMEAQMISMRLTPGDEDPQWDDLACYLYGAYIRSQGVEDGNKRASRAIYAAALLKGGRTFRVPDKPFEAFLQGPFFGRWGLNG